MKGKSCLSGYDPRLVGDPVDTLTGALVDRILDFRFTGFIELRWYRHYDSSQSHRSFSLGNGWAHDYERSLIIDEEGLLYEEAVGRTFRFPPLMSDGEECAFNGFRVQRVSSVCYSMYRHAQPTMEFRFAPNAQRARLTRLLQNTHEVKFWYDGAQKLIRIDDSAGRQLNAIEDEAGRLTHLSVEPTLTKPGFLLVAYHYDEQGNLIRTENEKGHGYAFKYDEANRLIQRRGRKGFQFYFKYDAQGRCIRSMGDDRLYGVALEYKVPGRYTKVTRPDLGVWHYHFTQKGELEEIIDPLGGFQKYIRDEDGRIALDIDPNGNVTKLIYDGAGEAIAKFDPLGHRIALPEDPNAPDPQSHRVAANAAEYEYGRLLDIKSIVLPDQAQVQKLSFSSTVRSQLFVKDERSDFQVLQQKYEVKPIGAMWWPNPKQGRVCNDLAKIVEQHDDFGRIRQWHYDESGNVAEYIDFDGGKWVHDYGTWHFLRGLTNPVGAELRFTYTSYGEVASFTDAGGTLSEYRYDLKDQLIEVKRHGVIRDSYTLDNAGNLIAKQASDGRELFRVEIGSGNLPIKRSLASGDEHTFQYDKSGRPLSASTKKDHVELAYDNLGNRIVEKRNGLGVEHRFQGWRKLAQSVFFDRFVVGYEWRENNTLIITDPGGKAHKIQFHGNGIVEKSFSNGSHETSQYDNLGRCLLKCLKKANGQTWQRRFHWSGEGDLRKIEDNVHGEVSHEYDAAHRLRQRVIKGRIEHYELDFADNLVAQPGLYGVTFREGNRLKTANGFSFDYNDRNHIETRHNPNSRISYFYDSRDQLVRVEMPEGVWEAEYDTFGRRTRKIWAGQITEYYWNRDQLIAEVHSNGNVRLYIYGESIALTPFLVFDYDSLDAEPEEFSCYFVITDQIGTPCLVEDERGTEVWSGYISPFGQVEVSADAKIELNLRFSGHYFDAEMGLHYNRFRYYDPALGRYLQSDPWGISGGYNLYAYLPNPLVAADVRGLGGQDEQDGDDKSKEPKDGKEGVKKPTPSGEESADKPLSKEEAFAKANAARDEKLAELDGLSNKQRNKVATVVGACDPVTGETGVGVKVTGQDRGNCAEDLAKADLAKKTSTDPSNFLLSSAERPRTGETIPVCTRCQDRGVTPDHVPPGTPFDPKPDVTPPPPPPSPNKE